MDSEYQPKAPRFGEPKKANRKSVAKARQDAFVEHYAIYGDLRRAVMHAGYPPNNALWHGQTLLASDEIQRRIIDARNERLERAGARKDAIIEHYAKMAFFDIGELFDEYGEPLSVHEMPESARRIIQKVVVTQRHDKEGRICETRTQFELPSRLAALDNMANAIGCKAAIKVDVSGKIQVNPFVGIVEAAQGNALRPATHALPCPENEASDAPSPIPYADFSEIDD